MLIAGAEDVDQDGEDDATTENERTDIVWFHADMELRRERKVNDGTDGSDGREGENDFCRAAVRQAHRRAVRDR
jgi:hypothetical protein